MIYVLSDVHGNLPRFDSILRQINMQADDTLYILGDVIDRYPDGIKLLRRIMKMPNVKMLLGNHEYMMLNAIGHCKDAADEKENTDIPARGLWYRNGGQVTHNQLKHLRKEHRAEVFDYIRQLPVNIDLEVNGTRYKLVHASTEESFDPANCYSYNYKNSTEFAVWDRWNETKPVPEGCVLIFGHTPTFYFQRKIPLSIWKCDEAVGIDCGCGFVDGRLACLRLDDMKEFYSEM